MASFVKAVRKKSKLRIAFAGVSGSGKTYSSLVLSSGIGGKVAVIDTERGSAQLYADQFDFDVLELTPPYSPERYIEAIKLAEKAGYDVLVLDSITHEWNGSGGILDIVDTIGKTKLKGNSYAAWNEGTPRHRAFIDAMLASPLHIIATIRTKAAYVESERNGKKQYQKQGTAPEQRDGIEYEFTTVLDLSVDGNFATASKDRTKLFRDPVVITRQTGEMLVEWLNKGDVAETASAQSAASTANEYEPQEEPSPFEKLISGIDYFLGTNRQGQPFTVAQLEGWYQNDEGRVVELKTYLTAEELSQANRYFEQVRQAMKEKEAERNGSKMAENGRKEPPAAEQQEMFPGSPNGLDYRALSEDYF